MSFQVISQDDGHILIMMLNADFDLVPEYSALAREVIRMIDEGPEDVVLISDSREVHFESFGDLMQSTSIARSPESQQVRQNPKVLKSFMITGSTVLTMVAKGLNSATFGFLELTVFHTMEDAIEAARDLLKSKG